MRKFCSVACHILAGLLLFDINLLAFAGRFSAAAKIASMIVFAMPAIIAMLVGLALTGFRQWRRDAGVVFLSTAVMGGFMVTTVACMMMSEELGELMPVDIFSHFNAHFVGVVVIAMYAGIGALLLKLDGERRAAPPGRTG
jgi:hypothetical protein